MRLLCLLTLCGFCAFSFGAEPADIKTGDQWLESLSDPLNPNFEKASKALEELGVKGLPVLQKLLKHPTQKVRANALEILDTVTDEIKDWNGEDVSLATDLGEELRSEPAGDLRKDTAALLEKLKARAAPAIPALIEALWDPVEDVSDQAKDALGAIGPAAVPALIEQLPAKPGRKNTTRQSAVEALGDIKPMDLATLKAMLPLLNEEDGDLREETAKSLPGKVDTIPGAQDWLLTVLKEDSDLSWAAAFELGKGRVSQAVSELLDVQKTTRTKLRLQAVLASLQFTTKGKPEEIPLHKSITDALDDPDMKIRFTAVDLIELGLRSEQDSLRGTLRFTLLNLQWLTGDVSLAVRESARSASTRLDNQGRVQVEKRAEFQKLPDGWVAPVQPPRGKRGRLGAPEELPPPPTTKPEKPVPAPEF